MEIEKKMYHLKTKMFPVVFGTLGHIKKETQQEINKITNASSFQEIKKKTVLKSTAHILRRAWSIFFFLLIAVYCLI